MINTSDAREKTNIKNAKYGLNDLMKLRPVSFEWIKNRSRHQAGFDRPGIERSGQ
ncbi:MAG: tail fiber domain-containing protein [Saprospiraceae bacterium]|nr:tail fiber domain-containing protein [Saprospiraceae bacterium]